MSVSDNLSELSQFRKMWPGLTYYTHLSAKVWTFDDLHVDQHLKIFGPGMDVRTESDVWNSPAKLAQCFTWLSLIPWPSLPAMLISATALTRSSHISGTMCVRLFKRHVVHGNNIVMCQSHQYDEHGRDPMTMSDLNVNMISTNYCNFSYKNALTSTRGAHRSPFA